MASYKNSKLTVALENVPQKINSPDFPGYDMPHNFPSTFFCFLFPNTNPNPSYYYNHLRTIYTYSQNHSPILFFDFSIFYNTLSPPSFTLAHAHPLPLITFLYPASLILANGTNTSTSLLLHPTRLKFFKMLTKTWHDRSRLVIINSQTMFTLKDRKLFSVSPLIPKSTLLLAPFSSPVKSAHWASVGIIVLLTSLNWL